MSPFSVTLPRFAVRRYIPATLALAQAGEFYGAAVLIIGHRFGKWAVAQPYCTTL